MRLEIQVGQLIKGCTGNPLTRLPPAFGIPLHFGYWS